MAEIEIKNVSFSYKENEVLSEVSLAVEPGECVLLCGESGCGKTSLTKLVNGLIPHFIKGEHLEGEALVCGMPVADTQMYVLAQSVGSVFQNPKSQFFNLDSDSELAFGLENEGVPKEEMERRIAQVVEQLEIADLQKRSIFAMSGGEKQLLAFASVYALSPKVYVLDEPSANLDDWAIERLKKQIALICRQKNTVLITEHRLSYIADIADRIVYMKNGRIERQFGREEFLRLTEEELAAMGLRRTCASRIELEVRASNKPLQRDMQSALRVENLACKRKKKEIFSGFHLQMKEGEIVGIVGHNGVGKSTLLRCLCGLSKEAQGAVSYQEKRLSPKERSRMFYMVMQDVNHQLFGDSVWDECEMMLSEPSKEKIEEVLDWFDLLSYKDRHPMALSGGQRQRLAMAGAVLSGRRILVLDEPTSGLDYRHMLEVSKLLRRLADEGYMIIIVTHDMEFLNCTCDKCVRME